MVLSWLCLNSVFSKMGYIKWYTFLLSKLPLSCMAPKNMLLFKQADLAIIKQEQCIAPGSYNGKFICYFAYPADLHISASPSSSKSSDGEDSISSGYVLLSLSILNCTFGSASSCLFRSFLRHIALNYHIYQTYWHLSKTVKTWNQSTQKLEQCSNRVQAWWLYLRTQNWA